jgi:ribonucrease Y
MDYLVIAADAISGARPGARRSTAQTYTQKIQDLQEIAFQFDGVTDTHIVSAGREVRVYVDGTRVDDHGALKISEGIVEKIESEMAYPGQIKVTVVRSTQAVEFAR